MLRWRFDEATFAVAIALYTMPEPLPAEALRELVYAATDDSMLFAPATEAQQRTQRQLTHNDTNQLIAQLTRLGATEVRDDAVTLTPLGVGLVAGHLRGLGVDVPTIGSLCEETAEVVVATAATTTPETADQLLSAWCAHNPGTARAELRALAERTDDRAHRKLAKAYAKR